MDLVIKAGIIPRHLCQGLVTEVRNDSTYFNLEEDAQEHTI